MPPHRGAVGDSFAQVQVLRTIQPCIWWQPDIIRPQQSKHYFSGHVWYSLYNSYLSDFTQSFLVLLPTWQFQTLAHVLSPCSSNLATMARPPFPVGRWRPRWGRENAELTSGVIGLGLASPVSCSLACLGLRWVLWGKMKTGWWFTRCPMNLRPARWRCQVSTHTPTTGSLLGPVSASPCLFQFICKGHLNVTKMLVIGPSQDA